VAAVVAVRTVAAAQEAVTADISRSAVLVTVERLVSSA